MNYIHKVTRNKFPTVLRLRRFPQTRHLSKTLPLYMRHWLVYCVPMVWKSHHSPISLPIRISPIWPNFLSWAHAVTFFWPTFQDWRTKSIWATQNYFRIRTTKSTKNQSWRTSKLLWNMSRQCWMQTKASSYSKPLWSNWIVQSTRTTISTRPNCFSKNWKEPYPNKRQ